MRTWTITGVAVMVAVVVAIGPADMGRGGAAGGGVGCRYRSGKRIQPDLRHQCPGRHGRDLWPWQQPGRARLCVAP